MKIIFITVLVVVLICMIYVKSKDTFESYPYNPFVPTPLSNYECVNNRINELNNYKQNISVSLGPTPTINCSTISNKNNCNKYGCNWFGTFCSSTYPTQI